MILTEEMKGKRAEEAVKPQPRSCEIMTKANREPDLCASSINKVPSSKVWPGDHIVLILSWETHWNCVSTLLKPAQQYYRGWTEITLVLRTLRQKDNEFKVSVGYIERKADNTHERKERKEVKERKENFVFLLFKKTAQRQRKSSHDLGQGQWVMVWRKSLTSLEPATSF